MRENLTQNIEDYLKTIYEITTTASLEVEQQRASTNQIAEALGVTPASVTGMIKKLSETEPPLLEYRRHYGVLLTPAGEQVALEIIRHHRLLEMFLHQILGYEWDEVHAEADRLEHFISEEFEERIATALGDPTHDPHGDPIPDRDLHIPASTAISLYKLRPGDRAVVERVDNEEPELLRYLGGLGIVPQASFAVLDFSPYDGNLSLQIDGHQKITVVGPAISKKVFVCLESETA